MSSAALGTTFVGPNETFEITDFLGQGAFGEVYRAGEMSGTVVAVKLLPLGALASPDSKIALLNEINAAQQIRHPNVVQVLHDNRILSFSAGGMKNMANHFYHGNVANSLKTRSANAGVKITRDHPINFGMRRYQCTCFVPRAFSP